MFALVSSLICNSAAQAENEANSAIQFAQTDEEQRRQYEARNELSLDANSAANSAPKEEDLSESIQFYEGNVRRLVVVFLMDSRRLRL